MINDRPKLNNYCEPLSAMEVYDILFVPKKKDSIWMLVVKDLNSVHVYTVKL